MKRTVLLLIATLASYYSNAQNTPWSTSGNIGIGTTTPSAPLNIFASGALTDLYPEQLTIGSSVPYNASPVASILFTNLFNSSGTNAGLAQIAVGKENSGNGDLASFMAFSTRTSGGSVADRVRITSTGNVGIGTTTPTDRLVVNGNIKAILDPSAYSNQNIAGFISLGYSGITGARNWAVRGVYQYANGVGQNAVGGDLDLIKSQDGNTILGTKSDGTPLGNVLIGRTNQLNASYMLDVAGPAHATSIVVNSGGADFVFEPAYHLNSLPWLAKYINQNHHLPEIPSAKQMQADGLNVGDNQVKLLQKVEELTLYLIEKDKKQKDDENKIQSQQKQISSQQQEIDLLKQQVQLLIKSLNKNQLH